MLKELALLSGMITKDRDTSVLSFLNVKFQAETNWIFPSNALAWVRIVQIVHKCAFGSKVHDWILTVSAMSAADDT